jgi:hypothetical protein
VSKKLEAEIAQLKNDGGLYTRRGVTTRSEESWTSFSQLSQEDGQRAALALRNLAFGGEFADWVMRRRDEIPALARNEFEEATSLISEFLRKYPPPPRRPR